MVPFRIFRGPLFHKPVAGPGLFFAVSYSKPALKKYLLQITLLTDRFATVRIAAFHCITECVKAVTNVPLSDANIFPEYILPNLVPLCNDRNDLVRAAFASR